jgi:hypothetical protein
MQKGNKMSYFFKNTVKVMALVVFTLVFAIFSVQYASAQDSVLITPSPLGFSNYQLGEKSGQLDGNFVNLSSDDLDMNMIGINYKGASVSTADARFANHYSIGGSLLRGDFDNGDMYGLGLNGSFTPSVILGDPTLNFKPILFAGGLFSFQTLTADQHGSSSSDSVNIFSYGIQAGGQLNIISESNKYIWAPFILLQSMMCNSSKEDFDYTSTSYGIDILFVEYGITFSSMLQFIAKDDDSDMNSIMFQVGKKF